MRAILDYIFACLAVALDPSSIDLAQAILFLLFIGAGLYHAFAGGRRLKDLVAHWRTALFVLCALVFTRLVFSQYFLYQKLQNKNIALQQKLDDISLTRPISYTGTAFLINLHKDKKLCDIAVQLRFQNYSIETIKWKIDHFYLISDHKSASLTKTSIWYFAQPNQSLFFNSLPILDLDCKKIPKIIVVHYLMEYDNMSPLRGRIIERIMKYYIPAIPTNDVSGIEVFSSDR